MQLARYLPNLLLRHKVVELLIRFGFQERIIKLHFNSSVKAFIDLNDPEPRNIFIKGNFDLDFFDIANCLLPEKGVYFDLGANFGLCTFGLVPQKKDAKYHLFEANDYLIKFIKKSVKLYPTTSFNVNHGCLNNEDGESNFQIVNTQSGQSHVSTNNKTGKKVKNIVLDNYCSIHEISHVDFAKIDLEGHELKVLEGWRSHLQKHYVKSIIIEVIPENQKRYGLKTNECLIFLELMGYDLYFFKPEDLKKDSRTTTVNINGQNIILSKFLSSEYPVDLSTDILALSP
tara:strand:+ start:308 stop:1168 length:861 start_codon:yes stop_codon:yes gene_type:complete